jgi:hypothetical protein
MNAISEQSLRISFGDAFEALPILAYFSYNLTQVVVGVYEGLLAIQLKVFCQQ